MELPVQVGECIGCGICIRECPVEVMTLLTVPGQTPLADHQGPVAAAPPDDGHWVPLTSVTRESLKPDHPSPFSPFFEWQTRSRPEPWQAWTTMVESRREGARGAVPDGVSRPAPMPAATSASSPPGRYDEAYEVAAEVNPFPSVCGWICTAPCEAACRRGTLDEPISIRTLKRFAVEHGKLQPAPPPTVRRSERVAIVGGGPAGMSAAWYLARLGYAVTVFEAMPVPGGMMAIGIPEYRLPRDVLQAEIQRILALGVELRLDSAMGRDFSLTDLESQGFHAVFLATGASRSRPLDVPGADLEGVVPATLFLKRVNLGEHPRLDGPVVVVGGGSTAMDAARSAWRSGASSVTVLYRRDRADMPAQVEEIEAAEREGIVIRTGVGIVEVTGHGGRVVAVQTIERQPTPGASPIETFADVPGSESTVPASTVLVAIGEEPDPSILPEGAGIGVTASAGIVADPRSLATGRAGVFAGGDVVSGAKTVIDAVAAGRRAAASIHEFLARVTNGEAAIMAAVRYPKAPEPQLAGRPRRAAAGPSAGGPSRAGLLPADPGRLRSGDGPNRSLALLPLRCRLPLRGRDGRRRPRRPQSTADAVAQPRLVRPANQVPAIRRRRASREDRHDTRPGSGLLRFRRSLRRGHDRRRAGRAVAARAGPAHGAAVHGPRHQQVHAAPRAPTSGGSSSSPCATSSSSRSSSAASSSSTRTWSSPRSCRSRAALPPSAPSRPC